MHEEREAQFGPELMRELERSMLLRCVDMHWMDHIDAMDEFKRSVGLRAYGQKDPVVVFRQESYDMFDDMTCSIREATVRTVLNARVRTEEEVKREKVAEITGVSGSGDGSEKGRTVRNKDKKVGPNDPCPCGSGKKYKKCCGSPSNR